MNCIYGKAGAKGILYVMMRGINHQNIFEEPEDYYQLKELKDKGASYRQLERLTGVGRGLIQKL